MKVVVLDGFKESSPMENILTTSLDLSRESFSYFKLNNYNILPCISCGSCNEDTPGICILKDDYEIIIRKLAECDLMIFLSPITFGTYSSSLKKIVDRFMTLSTAFYTVKGGILLHKMRYDFMNLITIGEIDKSLVFSDKSISSFKLLSSRNALNMNLKLDCFIYDKKDSDIKGDFDNFIKKSTLDFKICEVKHV